MLTIILYYLHFNNYQSGILDTFSSYIIVRDTQPYLGNNVHKRESEKPAGKLSETDEMR